MREIVCPLCFLFAFLFGEKVLRTAGSVGIGWTVLMAVLAILFGVGFVYFLWKELRP